MQLVIRPFRLSDVDALSEIATLSFAEEYEARGQTAADFNRQIQTATRGRMIPFKIFSRLAGYTWAIFVAEMGGRIVGCGGYIGRQQVALVNLMVHPHYRRRGIGQALLQKRLAHLAQSGYPYVTTTVLGTNTASLGNLAKQGFEIFDRYTVLGKSLMAVSETAPVASALSTHPLTPGDRPTFRAIEAALTSPEQLALEGSREESYFPPLGQRLLTKLTGGQFWTRAFTHQGEIVGILASSTSNSQQSGTIGRPLVTNVHLPHLPAMMQTAETWLAAQGKTKAQLSAPTDRPRIPQMLQELGWAETYTWVRLVKKLSA